MTVKIVVLDRDTLVKRPFDLPFPHTLTEYPHTLPTDTATRIAGADIIVSNKVAITAEHMAANPQLKLIAVAATGYNNIDLVVFNLNESGNIKRVVLGEHIGTTVSN